MTTERVVLCPLAELGDGEARRVDVADVRVAVVRLGDAVYVVDDECTHADYSLSEGVVDAEECTLECWKHGAVFSLETGEALTLPATRPIEIHPASIADGQVEIEIPVEST